MKSYNDLSDIEKGWIREYQSWCKCGKNDPTLIELALIMAEQYSKFLANHGLRISDYI